MSGENQGPDLFFAGGECLTRFGVWVRRTDMDLEAATRETFTRDSDATAIGRDGIIRTWEPDTARAEWLNEVSIDPTRNLLPTTDVQAWDRFGTVEVAGEGPIYRVEDTGAELGFMNGLNSTFGLQNETLTLSCLLQKRVGAPTVNVRMTWGTNVGAIINPETGAFIEEGIPTSVTVVDLGNGWWEVRVTESSTDASFSFNFIPAWGAPGTLSGTQDNAATGTNAFRYPQIERGSVATDFQETPRDLDRKFPTLILERGIPNDWSRSEEFDNANYVKSRVTVDPDVEVAPDGAATADKIVEDNTANNSHFWNRVTPSLTDNSFNTVSFFVKPAGRDECQMSFTLKDGSAASAWFDVANGVVGTLTGVGTIGRILERLPDGWLRVSITFDALAGGTAPSCSLSLGSGGEDRVYDGDGVSGIFMWGIQFTKNNAFANSYFPTGVALDSAADDLFIAAFTAPPIEMTFYTRFIESGTVLTASSRVFQISSSGGGQPRLILQSDGVRYQLFHQSEGTNLAVETGPAVGDLVELLSILNADGSVQLRQAINLGPIESSPLSGPEPLGGAWSAPTIFLNSAGTGAQGITRFLAVKAQRGVRDLDFMRAL